MKNIKEIKSLILKSLDLLPLDIQNRYVKSHLMLALEEIKKLENKNGRKFKI